MNARTKYSLAREREWVSEDSSNDIHTHLLYVRCFGFVFILWFFVSILIICLVRSLNDRVCIIIRVQFGCCHCSFSYCRLLLLCNVVAVRVSFIHSCIWMSLGCLACSINWTGWHRMGSRRHADEIIIFTLHSLSVTVDGIKSIKIHRLCVCSRTHCVATTLLRYFINNNKYIIRSSILLLVWLIETISNTRRWKFTCIIRWWSFVGSRVCTYTLSKRTQFNSFSIVAVLLHSIHVHCNLYS